MPEEGVVKTELDSGIRVLTEVVPGVRSVSLGVWVDVGSRDESETEVGMSHFIEHLLFKGTPSLDAKGIAEAFDHMGADVNAVTGREHTSVYTRLLNQFLPDAVGVVMDMLRNSLFDHGEIDSERKVVLEEIAMHLDSPDEMVHDELAMAMWGDHSIAHTVLGEADVIKGVRKDRLLDFQKRTYVGSRLVVSAAGAVDHASLVEAVAAGTAGMVPGTPSDRSGALESPLSRKQVYYKETEQAHICLGAKGIPRNHPDRFALAVMDNILGGSMSSRLFQSVREAKGLAYAIYSYTGLFIGMGMVGIYCGTHPTQADRVIEVIEDELIRARDEGFTDEEMTRSKNHIEGSLFISMEDSGNRMNRIAKAEMAEGEHLAVEEMVERVHAVTRDDMDRVFSETWGVERPSLAVVGPFSEDSVSLSGRF